MISGLYTCFDPDGGSNVVFIEVVGKIDDLDYAKIRWLYDNAVTFEPLSTLVENYTFFDDPEKCLAFYQPKEPAHE